MVLFYRVIGSLAGLSMFGSGLIVLTSLLFSRLRKHPYSLVMWLSICDFFFSLKYVFVAIYPNSWTLNENLDFCRWTGLYTNFFALASVSWSAVLSFNLIVNTAQPFGDTQSNAKWYHLFVWSISGLSTLLVGLLKDTGVSADGTCWFPSEKNFHWQFYVPLALYFLLAIGATLFSIFRTWNFSHGATRYAVKLIIRMTLYVSVFIASWLGPTVHEIYTNFHTVTLPSAPSSSVASNAGSSFPSSIVPNLLSTQSHIGSMTHTLQFATASPNIPGIQHPSSSGDSFKPGTFTWWTGVSVSLIGFLNAIIWLSNPTIYRLIKTRLVRRYCRCWYKHAERIPLIGKLESVLLEDQDHDLHQLNVVFRNNALSSLLLGIRYSLSALSKDQSFASDSFKFEQTLSRAGRERKQEAQDPKRRFSGAEPPTLPIPEEHMSLNAQTIDMEPKKMDSEKNQQTNFIKIQKKGNGANAKQESTFTTSVAPHSYEDENTISLRNPASVSASYGAIERRHEETDEEEDLVMGWSIPKNHEVHAVPALGSHSKSKKKKHHREEDTGGSESDVSVLDDSFLAAAEDPSDDSVDGFVPDDQPHLLSNLDFSQVVELDLSPENLEILDVPDLFTSPFHLRDFAPHVFHNIRVRFGFKSKEYYNSLSPGPFLTAVLENAEFSSGRSGAFMCYSPNKKFLIKTIPNHEADTMRRILPAYFAHVETNLKTLLTPILGLYSLRLSGAPALNIIVMANLFSHELLAPSMVYDLKGSWVDRGGKTKRGTRKDNDLKSPFHIAFQDATELFAQLDADSQMLAQQGVMDYSLLVGVRDSTSSRSSNAYIPPRKLKISSRGNPNVQSLDTSEKKTSLKHLDSVPSLLLTTQQEQEEQQQTNAPLLETSFSAPSSPQYSRHSLKPGTEPLLLQDEEITLNPAMIASTNPEVNLFGKKAASYMLTRASTSATVITSSDKQETYIIGIIDMLQSYTFTKKVERLIKVYFRCKSKEGLSATNPEKYQQRFRVAMARNIGYGNISQDYDV